MTRACFGFHFATHCNADQRTRNAATRCVLRTYNAARVHDPAGGAYSAPPDPLAGFKGTNNFSSYFYEGPIHFGGCGPLDPGRIDAYRYYPSVLETAGFTVGLLPPA